MHQQIRSIWLGPIFFCLGDSQTKGLLALLHRGLEGVTEVDNDPKGRFVSFTVTPSNDRVLYVYIPSAHSTKDQLVRGRFSEGLRTYIENKCEGNENKIILEDFNSTIDKMDRDSKNKT